MAGTDLTSRQRAILDFERDWRQHEGGKGAAIQARFGISASRYHQLLARTATSDAALAYDPLLVRRLRRRARARVAAGAGQPAQRGR